MRTTIILDDELIEEARRLTGIKEKTKLIHLGLETLIKKEARERLILLGGTDPKAILPMRKKFK